VPNAQSTAACQKVSHPGSLAWLWEHWGATWSLRRIEVSDADLAIQRLNAHPVHHRSYAGIWVMAG
jgi:hypothetical protein